MQLHPSLSRQITQARMDDARARADRARLARIARCAPTPPNDERRAAPRRGCQDPLPV
jgi:hypothetical protein